MNFNLPILMYPVLNLDFGKPGTLSKTMLLFRSFVIVHKRFQIFMQSWLTPAKGSVPDRMQVPVNTVAIALTAKENEKLGREVRLQV
jgi:hypothetical protein